jgi:glycosyltransferase involved in cell wall biosynthesis
MSDQHFTIVIATSGRRGLLSRTMASLAEAVLPSQVGRVVVAENGPPGDAKAVAQNYAGKLPVIYLHSETQNKSRALNRALDACEGGFVIFFDDDIRLDPQCLVAYVETVTAEPRRIFVGGQCEVDYETPPPEWLKSYLPHSAIGWSKGNTRVPLDQPLALGFNWGAYASDIKAVGGFDEDKGPGTLIPIGEETKLQKDLLDRGIPGIYEPRAKVWHYVPRERCSQTWALRRVRHAAFLRGAWILAHAPERKVRIKRLCRRRLLKFLLAGAVTARIWPQKSFHFKYWAENQRGCLEALNAGREARGTTIKRSQPEGRPQHVLE